MTQSKIATQSAYQFSRVNPPRVLVPVNNNAVGAHNELLPNNNYEPEPVHLVKRVKKRIVHQRKTEYEDPNKAKETPLHPPYESYSGANLQGRSTLNNGPIAF